MSTRGAWRPRLSPWGAALLVAGVLILPIASAHAASRATAMRSGVSPGRPLKRSDVAAARALVAAQTRYYAAGLATRREAGADVKAFIADLSKRCPNALPDTLLDGTAGQRTVYKQLFTEGAIDIGLIAQQPVGDATATEAQALDRIRFSRRAINHDLRDLARSQRATLTLAPEDMCDDITLAANGGFTQVPLTTTRFIDRVDNVLAGPAPSFDDLVSDVRPYMLTRHDAAAVRHMRAVGSRYTNFVFNLGIASGTRLAHVLGGTL
jgi:hypothetical protein